MNCLHRLTYSSTPRQGMDEAQLRHILRSARKNNEASGLSGFLAFSSEHFVQVIEGGRAALTNCFTHIARDPRHHSLVLLSFDPIEQRGFSDWSMGYMALGPGQRSTLMRYSPDGMLHPESLAGPALQSLLRELAAHVSLPVATQAGTVAAAR
jgi:hypothetical protein